MVAALSWAARLKTGLARTREVLNTPVSELFARRRVDESLFEDLETALLQADCGVAATQWLVATLREKARKQKIEDGAALKERSEEHTSELQSPCNIVCRLLLEKKKKHHQQHPRIESKSYFCSTILQHTKTRLAVGRALSRLPILCICNHHIIVLCLFRNRR